MPAAITEDIDEQVGAAVDNLWMIGKILGGIHHSEHPSDAAYFVEAAKFLPHCREQHKTDESCVLVALLHSQISAELPWRIARPDSLGPVPAKKTKFPTRTAGT